MTNREFSKKLWYLAVALESIEMSLEDPNYVISQFDLENYRRKKYKDLEKLYKEFYEINKTE